MTSSNVTTNAHTRSRPVSVALDPLPPPSVTSRHARRPLMDTEHGVREKYLLGSPRVVAPVEVGRTLDNR